MASEANPENRRFFGSLPVGGRARVPVGGRARVPVGGRDTFTDLCP
ncbi:MAG: hypothetical protein J1E61_07640 [Lachnospiraceae bacterium]|nr:hypothetical protein [Lachnospiraceae bacterium]